MLKDPLDRVFARTLWDRCDPKVSLDISNLAQESLYEPLYDHDIYPESDDKVEKLYETIDLEDSESCQFFSGFSGSGKTTELKRLSKTLREAGYIVVYASALDYISETEPIDISDMLLVIAGAFGEAVASELAQTFTPESYWDRFLRFWQSEINLGDITFKGEAGAPTGPGLPTLKAGADVKIALKSVPSFRAQLHTLMENRIEKLTQDVHAFIAGQYELLKHDRPGHEGRVVFIVDEFEKVRGNRDTEQDVIKSIRHTFGEHLERLALPFLHVIYTVPPWLRFTLNKPCHIETLPSVRLWNPNQERTPYEPGLAGVRKLVRRRFAFPGPADAETNLRRAFGEPDAKGNYLLLDRLIVGSGGHFRDLLRLVRSTVKSARSLPVTSEGVEHALLEYKQDYLPIAINDALWLDRIARVQDYYLPDNEPSSVLQFHRFLNRQMVLYLTNGQEWYDVHPLLRDEVARIVEQERSEKARQGAS